jgi:bifunctional DNA-binding transcriptional regulator/antitoxin component of YhaV-PrlF toxin-antitoxin module
VVAPGWDALVTDNYNAVMPLPVRRKFGIKYLAQPIFTKQLGVFFYEKEKSVIDQFINKIQTLYYLAEINLNINNHFSETKAIAVLNNKNYYLKLGQNYSRIAANYNRSTKGNLRKASRFELKFCKSSSVDNCINFLANEMMKIIPGLTVKTYNTYRLLMKLNVRNLIQECYEVHYNDDLVAVGCFMSYNQNLICQTVSSEKGKKVQALTFLFDEYFKLKTNDNLILDFGGSNIQSIAYFFEGLGGKSIPYQSISINQLPRLFQWLKKK